MADNVRGEVFFQAEGTEYTLTFPTRSMIRLERDLGKPIGEIAERIGETMSLDLLCAIFWAGLIKHHPKLTKDDVADLMDVVGLNEVGNLVGQAFGAAFPEAEAAGGGARPPAMVGDGTGETSSGSGASTAARSKSSGTKLHA